MARVEVTSNMTTAPPERLHFRECFGGDTIDVGRLFSAVLHVNSAPWREYPAETLILRGVDVSPNATVDFYIDRGGEWVELERINRCQVYGRTDFNAIPELAAAVLVEPPEDDDRPLTPAEIAESTPFADGDGTPLTPGDKVTLTGTGWVCGPQGATKPGDIGEFLGRADDGYMLFRFPNGTFSSNAVSIKRVAPCPDCRGTGEYVGLTRTGPCQRCRGTGEYMVNGERAE